MARLLLSFFLVAVFAACSKDEEGQKVEKRSFEYFSVHLKATMDINAIKQEWGEPDEDRGSGIHIYVYKLVDNTSIWIGYTDHILYAKQMDSNNQLIRALI